MAGRGGCDPVGRASPGAVLKAAAAFFCLFAAIIFEQNLWDETMNQSPDVNTVSAFEIEEAGLSAVLSDAINDQRAIVEHLTAAADERRAQVLNFRSNGLEKLADNLGPLVVESEVMQFQAMSVLGLLEAAREREAGQVT